MGLRSLTACICGIYARFRSGTRPSAQVDKLLERSDGASDVACLRPADCHFDAPTAVSVAIASSVRWPNANNDAHPGSNPLTSIVPSHRVAPNLEVLLIAHPFITSPFPFFFSSMDPHHHPRNPDSPVPLSCKPASSTVNLFIAYIFTIFSHFIHSHLTIFSTNQTFPVLDRTTFHSPSSFVICTSSL